MPLAQRQQNQLSQLDGEVSLNQTALSFLIDYLSTYFFNPSELWRFYTDDSHLLIGNVYSYGQYQTYRQIFDFRLTVPLLTLSTVTYEQPDRYTLIISMTGHLQRYDNGVGAYTRTMTLFRYQPRVYSILYDVIRS